MGAFISTPPPILFKFCCIHVLLFIFIPRRLKMCGALWYTFRSKICVECTFVTISFPLSILSTFQPILFKLYIIVDIWEEEIDHRWVNLSNKHRGIALHVENWFRCFIFANYFLSFLQTLNESQYKDLGVLWDCK